MASDQPSITCPVCAMTSYNPNDIREGFCGNCHAWTSSRDGVITATTVPPPPTGV